MYHPDSVAICEKCGREFLTIPKDGRDPYDPRSGFRGNPLKPRLAEYEICGGAVVPVTQ